MAKPTILLVEDLAEIRDTISRKLHEAGARVLTTSTADEAFDLFKKRIFEVSALVTDVRLEDDGSHTDLSGVRLAQKISNVAPNLPRIGVTAFSSSVGEGILDVVYGKGRQKNKDPTSVFNNIERIVEVANDYDDARFHDVPEELIGLKQKYGISAPDFFRLISSWRIADLGRLALLTWHDVQGGELDDGPEQRRIEFVLAGTKIGSLPALQSDVAVVTHQTADGVIAQLFGMPLIFTYADTQAVAVTALIEHLHDCHSTIGSPEEFTGANVVDVVRFIGFLDRLFVPRGAKE